MLTKFGICWWSSWIYSNGIRDEIKWREDKSSLLSSSSAEKGHRNEEDFFFLLREINFRIFIYDGEKVTRREDGNGGNKEFLWERMIHLIRK